MKKVLRFSASWCQPCKALAKNIENANLSVPMEYVDIDEQNELAMQYKIRGVPTLVLLENGVETNRVSGVKTVAELKSFVGMQ